MSRMSPSRILEIAHFFGKEYSFELIFQLAAWLDVYSKSVVRCRSILILS